ncbi:hypothetical protein [Paraburkholderia aromaticivorans]|uniref:hypothetical protein n=1 Tax=Paraburkholderia aromaticivorans TaxID=2026199 RepID=UPI00197D8BF1|nr:hypothetical protein [Paraburkholderia aromaticivorans]
MRSVPPTGFKGLLERFAHTGIRWLDTPFGRQVVAEEDRRLLEQCGFVDTRTRALFLLARLPGALQVAPLGYDLSAVLTPILSGVTGLIRPVLKPIFKLLDTILVPTLSLLGVQVGTATVHNMSLTCGVSQLVN